MKRINNFKNVTSVKWFLLSCGFSYCINSDISKNKTPFSAISYPNAETYKKDVLKDNRGKTGIYMWTNLKSDDTYVGSALNLSRRLINYYSNTYLLRTNKGKSIIYNAILKLDILDLS